MDFNKIHDLLALRIITPDVESCYRVLGIIHKHFKPISGEINDLRKTIKNVEDTIHHIIKELELTAKKQEINIIEKYVSMMDPTRYVTKEEFEKRMMKK